ncbi:MAG: adenylate/guanylate cyclase domain-containing protein [Desulfobacterales bacterium]
MHAGFHHGPVVMDKQDVFGDAVNIASRLADYAKPKQIVTTQSTIEAMSEHSTPLIRYVSEIKVKNISDPWLSMKSSGINEKLPRLWTTSGFQLSCPENWN